MIVNEKKVVYKMNFIKITDLFHFGYEFLNRRLINALSILFKKSIHKFPLRTFNILATNCNKLFFFLYFLMEKNFNFTIEF